MGNLTYTTAEVQTLLDQLDSGYTVITDPITLTVYRIRSRDGVLSIDKQLTPTGFAGSEDTDWENVFITQ